MKICDFETEECIDWGTLQAYNNDEERFWVEISGTPTMPGTGMSVIIEDGVGSGTPTEVLGEYMVRDYIVADTDHSLWPDWDPNLGDVVNFGVEGPIRIYGENTTIEQDTDSNPYDCGMSFNMSAIDFNGPVQIDYGTMWFTNGGFFWGWFADSNSHFNGPVRIIDGNLMTSGSWNTGHDAEYSFASTVFLDNGELFMDQESFFGGATQIITFNGPFGCSGSFDTDQTSLINIAGDTEITFGGLTNFGGHFRVDQQAVFDFFGLGGDDKFIVNVLDNLVAQDYIFWKGASQAIDAADDIPVIASRSGTITYEGDADLAAISYAPNDEINIDKDGGTITGSLVGKSVSLNEGCGGSLWGWCYDWTSDYELKFPEDIRNRSDVLEGRESGQDSVIIFSWGPPG
ncbi:MAG: hypothetical protein R6U89_00035 [Dehalococcoidia bacterium]